MSTSNNGELRNLAVEETLSNVRELVQKYLMHI
jgi:hypothetical protein